MRHVNDQEGSPLGEKKVSNGYENFDQRFKAVRKALRVGTITKIFL